MTSTTEAVSTENDPGNKSAVAVMSPWRRNRTWSVLPPIRNGNPRHIMANLNSIQRTHKKNNIKT